MENTSTKAKLFDDFLPSYHKPPTTHAAYFISKHVKAQYPNYQHIITMDGNLPLIGYLKFKEVQTRVTEELRTHSFLPSNKMLGSVQIGLIEFTWEKTEFFLYKFGWPSEFRGTVSMYIMVFQGHGETKEEKEMLELVTQICRYKSQRPHKVSKA